MRGMQPSFRFNFTSGALKSIRRRKPKIANQSSFGRTAARPGGRVVESRFLCCRALHHVRRSRMVTSSIVWMAFRKPGWKRKCRQGAHAAIASLANAAVTGHRAGDPCHSASAGLFAMP